MAAEGHKMVYSMSMDALIDPINKAEVSKDPQAPTGWIAIGLRQTDRGIRMVRLFTTDTLPPEFEEASPMTMAATA